MPHDGDRIESVDKREIGFEEMNSFLEVLW